MFLIKHKGEEMNYTAEDLKDKSFEEQIIIIEGVK
jgi:hypothetical protein